MICTGRSSMVDELPVANLTAVVGRWSVLADMLELRMVEAAWTVLVDEEVGVDTGTLFSLLDSSWVNFRVRSSSRRSSTTLGVYRATLYAKILIFLSQRLDFPLLSLKLLLDAKRCKI